MAPLVPFSIINLLPKDCILLVDAVVGQVHELVFSSACSPLNYTSLVVFARGKSSKTFFEDVDSERINASDCDVDSQVKLISIDQKGIGDVLADHIVCRARRVGLLVYFFDSVSHEDTSSLGICCWFEDPLSSRLFLHCLLQVPKLIWKDEGLW